MTDKDRVKVYGRIDKDMLDFVDGKISDGTFYNWSHALNEIIKRYKLGDGK